MLSFCLQPEAWETANVILSSADAPAEPKLFAAQTFRAKASCIIFIDPGQTRHFGKSCIWRDQTSEQLSIVEYLIPVPSLTFFAHSHPAFLSSADHLRPRPATFRSPDTTTRHHHCSTQECLDIRNQSHHHSVGSCVSRPAASAARMDKRSSRHDRPVWKDSRDCACSAGLPEASPSRGYVQRPNTNNSRSRCGIRATE